MQLIYEQFRLQRELEALENSESEKNDEEKDGKKSKREEDNRIKYE